MKSRSPLWANHRPGIQCPSNAGWSVHHSSQWPPCRLWAFILDFPVVFHSQKRGRGKVREKKSTSIHKNLPWHENPDMLFLFSCLYKFKRTSRCLPPLASPAAPLIGQRTPSHSEGSAHIKPDTNLFRNMPPCIPAVFKSTPHKNHWS